MGFLTIVDGGHRQGGKLWGVHDTNQLIVIRGLSTGLIVDRPADLPAHPPDHGIGDYRK
jgi:hypothetical protein